ncbi:MAG: phosphatidylserine decarboxylase [Phycisphaerales bacterium]|nr:phosphatidylserine decarboxylase [Phycisphaerales bacterium]
MGITVPGWPIIGLFIVLSALVTAAALSWLGNWGWIAGGICGLLTLWCIWFFRDPERRTPGEPGLVISPADGVVCMVLPASPPPEIAEGSGEKLLRVSVFMNVFNVHVNRSPVDGRVEKLAYHPGKFFNASFDKASDLNERLSMRLRMPDGGAVVCVQIAGLVARRIVCQVREQISIARGERYGLIRFGSRVDVYLPAGYESLVKVGDKTTAGETVLGRSGDGQLVGAGAGRTDRLSAEAEARMDDRVD